VTCGVLSLCGERMNPERYKVVRVEGYGLGVLRKQHAHYAEVEVRDGGHLWNIIVDNEDFEVAHEITIGYEEVE